MKRVIEDIKTGEWKQIYLFTGSEDYLKLQYRDKLIQALMPEGDTMNLSRFQGKGQDVREIISLGAVSYTHLSSDRLCLRGGKCARCL